MSEQNVIWCSRCGKKAGNTPQEVWHSCGGYICGACAEKEIAEEETDDDI